jgi:hypothetical protein
MADATHANVMPSSDDDAGDTCLCFSCMTPNDRRANFCEKCGAPLQSMAAMGPFEGIFAEGFAYRQAANNPQKLIVVVGVWFMFGIMAAGSGAILFDDLTARRPSWLPPSQLRSLEQFEMTAITLFLLIVSVLMIWRTTKSYLARPKGDCAQD